MTDELFPPESVASLSPRIQWLIAHNLVTEKMPDDIAGMESPETGDEIPRWVCRVKKENPECAHYSPREIGGGDTEDEACADLAINRNIKLWNETP